MAKKSKKKEDEPKKVVANCENHTNLQSPLKNFSPQPNKICKALSARQSEGEQKLMDQILLARIYGVTISD